MKKEQVVGTTIVRITCSIHLAPQVGLEPTTLRLTAACSAIRQQCNRKPINNLSHCLTLLCSYAKNCS